jgi:hypothetical protein
MAAQKQPRTDRARRARSAVTDRPSVLIWPALEPGTIRQIVFIFEPAVRNVRPDLESFFDGNIGRSESFVRLPRSFVKASESVKAAMLADLKPGIDYGIVPVDHSSIDQAKTISAYITRKIIPAVLASRGKTISAKNADALIGAWESCVFAPVNGKIVLVATE